MKKGAAKFRAMSLGDTFVFVIFLAGKGLSATPLLMVPPILHFWEMSGFEPKVTVMQNEIEYCKSSVAQFYSTVQNVNMRKLSY